MPAQIQASCPMPGCEAALVFDVTELSSTGMTGVPNRESNIHIFTHSPEPMAGELAIDVLNALPARRTARDSAGDLWTKLESGDWTCDEDSSMVEEQPYVLTADALVHVWAPITLVQEEN